MLERLGMRDRDWRNLAVVAVVIAIVMAILIGGPVAVRVTAGVMAAVISGLVFLVTTIALKQLGIAY